MRACRLTPSRSADSQQGLFIRHRTRIGESTASGCRPKATSTFAWRGDFANLLDRLRRRFSLITGRDGLVSSPRRYSSEAPRICSASCSSYSVSRDPTRGLVARQCKYMHKYVARHGGGRVSRPGAGWR